jgi:hypothetical protein
MKYATLITLSILIAFVSCKQQSKDVEKAGTETLLPADTVVSKYQAAVFFLIENRPCLVLSSGDDFYREIHNHIASLFFSKVDKTRELRDAIKQLEYTERTIENTVVMDSLLAKEYGAVMLSLAYCYAKAGSWEKAMKKCIKLHIYEKPHSEAYQEVSLLSAIVNYKQTGDRSSLMYSLERIKKQYEIMRVAGSETYENYIQFIQQINQQS